MLDAAEDVLWQRIGGSAEAQPCSAACQGWRHSRSSRRLECIGSQPSASRVWVLDEGWSIAKIRPRGRRSPVPPPPLADPAPADDRGDITYCVALVGHGVPGGPGRRQLQGQPEKDCRVERVHGRPALGAVARVAGHSGPARGLGQQTSEPALAWLWTVRGMRTAVLRTLARLGPRTAMTERPRPPTGPSVGRGSASVETRPGTTAYPRP